MSEPGPMHFLFIQIWKEEETCVGVAPLERTPASTVHARYLPLMFSNVGALGLGAQSHF